MFDRYFYDNAGTIVDRTIQWANPYTSTGTWDAKTYIYISSFFPFNHKFFDVSTANDQAGTLTVEVWYNNEWTSVVDIIDYTKSTYSLDQSGNVFFTLNDLKGWDEEPDSSDITELASTKVYNAYWMRIGYGASAESALVINYVGHRFCDDYALFSKYPQFDNSAMLTRFKAGKTDWTEQEISASDSIISDLRSRNLLLTKDQILDAKRFEDPCVHKTAEIIYAGMGRSFEEDRILARRLYQESMNTGGFGIDGNANGTYDRQEKTAKNVRMGR